jgi:glycosyltransferase involved in cell wall biosynthesis
VRVLVVNKYLFPNAGAETVALGTRELLADAGHEVLDFAMRDPRNVPSAQAAHFAPARAYDGAGAGRDALHLVYSRSARAALRGLLAERRPDVAHLHNVYHQLTTSVIDELVAHRIPTVLTLHDYKPVCPSYELFTEGAPCRRCVGRPPLGVIRHRCIRGSLPASALAAAEAALTRVRRSYHRVDRLIAPSRFMAGVLAAGGFDPRRIDVLPNFVPAPGPAPGRASDPPLFLYVGRLEEVKGVDVLLDAWAAGTPPGRLAVVGRGPLEDRVRAAPGVEHLGFRPPAEVARLMAEARALVFPSVWEENCPMVVLEAQAAGLPVLGTDRGGLPELVADGVHGLLVPAGEPAVLRAGLERLATDPELARRLGAAGRERAAAHAPAAHLERLLGVYAAAMAARGRAAA